MLQIREATPADFDRIMEIYRYAQDFMIRSGNPTQWGHSYPDAGLIREDIRQHICRVVCDADGVHGVFALFNTPEPNYREIEDGAWLNEEDAYMTIHRVAGDGQVHGLLTSIVDYVGSLSDNIRIDTHADNLIMQKLILRNGFQRCGIVHMEDGTPRIGYQRCRRG